MGIKNNDHKKLFRIDRFARYLYCDHARLNQLREDKKRAKKAARKARKKVDEEWNI